VQYVVNLLAHGEPGQQLGAKLGQALHPRDERRPCLKAGRPPLVCLYAPSVLDRSLERSSSFAAGHYGGVSGPRFLGLG
jgi:hypothetical protein